MSAAQEAPALPGEVWRGLVRRRICGIAVDADGAHVAHEWWPGSGNWVPLGGPDEGGVSVARIFAAWGRAKAAEVDRLTRERDEARAALADARARADRLLAFLPD